MSISAFDGDTRTAGTMPVWRPSTGGAAYRPDSLAPAAGNPSESEEKFGFFDLLDIVNPLQHLPIVSFVYREITDDHIKPISQIAGGGLYGGLIGAAASAANVVVAEETGKDIPGNLVSLVTGKGLSHEESYNGERIASALSPEPVVSEPLPNLPTSDQPALAKVHASEKSTAGNLPGTLVALADLRKPAMKSFVLNT